MGMGLEKKKCLPIPNTFDSGIVLDKLKTIIHSHS